MVEQLVRCWLQSPDVGVGERASKVLVDLLKVDAGRTRVSNSLVLNGSVDGTTENGEDSSNHKLWRLIMLNRSILSLIVTLCSTPTDTSLTPQELRAALRQTSLSQGRLLRLLPPLATLSLHTIIHSEFTDLFPIPEPAAAELSHGLLQWAALTMVDKSDILMHLSLIDFFEALVSVMRVSADDEDFTKRLVKIAVRNDPELLSSLRGLPDRTIEDEAEPLRSYINDLLN